MGDTTKRDAVQEEFYAPYYMSEYDESAMPLEEVDVLVIDSMIDEIVRLRDILAALREPSEAMVTDAAEYVLGYNEPDYRDIRTAIVAAVAFAEQEVAEQTKQVDINEHHDAECVICATTWWPDYSRKN